MIFPDCVFLELVSKGILIPCLQDGEAGWWFENIPSVGSQPVILNLPRIMGQAGTHSAPCLSSLSSSPKFALEGNHSSPSCRTSSLFLPSVFPHPLTAVFLLGLSGIIQFRLPQTPCPALPGPSKPLINGFKTQIA